ncbi:MAG: DUF882 domain-containing protein [Candidatus Eisenbacteria bacterium]|nr:DUF882 domain-containing protein [Candidatus Eisenbacteria bacterium]
MERRRFLLGLAASLGTTLILETFGWQSRALAGDLSGSQVLPASLTQPRELSLLHTHTGERLSVAYFERGEYLPDALEAVNHLLRDHRTDAVHPIDPALLDILHDLKSATGSTGEYKIISGYRSPETNASLRKKSRGVAKHSLHLDGRAIDVRLDGVELPTLHSAALALSRGGVGYYGKSDFVHLDTGAVRSW